MPRLNLQILSTVAKGRKKVIEILMISNLRVSTDLLDVGTTDSVDTGLVISIRSASEDAPVNKNNNDATVYGALGLIY